MEEKEKITGEYLPNEKDEKEVKAQDDGDEVDEIIDAITSDRDELEEADVSLTDKLLKSNRDDLNEVIESAYAIDIAIALEDFSDDDLLKFYGKIDDEHMAQILEQMDENLQQRFVALLPYKRIIALFSYMSNDDIADILGEMPMNRRKDLTRLMKSKDTADIQSLLLYDDDTAGGIMTTEYIAIPADYTVEKTLKKIKEIGPKTEVIDTIFALDGIKKLVGVADLRDILSAPDDTKLSEIMDDNVISVTPDMDQEEVSRLVAKYDLKAIPVVNRKGALLGIITVDDIIDVLVEEQNEDIMKLGGTNGSEDIDEPVFQSVKKRMPWLLILLILGMVVSSVVSAFEFVVAALPIVMSFQSLILDMAGNVGTQSLAVTIRALTDDSISVKDKLALLSKEARVGVLNGLILAVFAVVGIGIYIYRAKGHNIHFAFGVSLCIGLALILAMLISSIVGTCIPMFFKRIGVDPAVASGPLITTVNDLVAVVAYYGLVWLLLIKLWGMSY